MQPITQTSVKDTLLHTWIRGILADIADPELFKQWETNRGEWTRHEKVLFHSRLQQIRNEKREKESNG